MSGLSPFCHSAGIQTNAEKRKGMMPKAFMALGVVALMVLAYVSYKRFEVAILVGEQRAYDAGQAERTALGVKMMSSSQAAAEATPRALALAIASGIASKKHIRAVQLRNYYGQRSETLLSDVFRGSLLDDYEVVTPGTIGNLADNVISSPRPMAEPLRASAGWTNSRMYLGLTSTAAIVGVIVDVDGVRKGALLYARNPHGYFEFQPVSGVPGVPADQLYTSAYGIKYETIKGQVSEALRKAELALAAPILSGAKH
jgi:hypothetical protein